MGEPLRFVYGNVCVAGDGSPWALFVVRPHSLDGLSADAQRECFAALCSAVEAARADLQIIRVRRPVSAAKDAEATEPWVAIAVCLAENELASALRRGLSDGRRDWRRAVGDALGIAPRGSFAVAHLEQLRRRADGAHARLDGLLDVRAATTAEVQWLVRRAFCRGLGEPVVDGLHEPPAVVFEVNERACLQPLDAGVLRWFDGLVEHRGRLLRIESELGVGYQALLTLGALPDELIFPALNARLLSAIPDALPFGVDLTLNARYLPNAHALRLVRRRIQDADQILRAEDDGEQGASDRGYARTRQARDLLAYLQAPEHPALLRATISLAVAAPDPEELDRRVAACRAAYGEIALHRPLGEQLRLFCQHLPAQRPRARGYDDVLTVEQVAAMMPTAGRPIGSRGGVHLAHTLGGGRTPVTFDLSEGSRTERPTSILCVGSLGSGKTMLAQTLMHHAFAAGARIVDVDPKGDHRFHELADVAPHVQAITLLPEPRLRGLLDPLRVAPTHLRHDAAVAFLCELLPSGHDPAWVTAIVRAVDAVVHRDASPTCGAVIDALTAGDQTAAHAAEGLAVYARTGLGQLGFASADSPSPPIGDAQVTYLALRDLPAPQPGVDRAQYTHTERVAEQIVRLVALLAMDLMGGDRDRLKVFGFDEGWRLLQDPAGRLLLSALARMGRSELAVPIIATQLVTDALSDREATDNLIGATFAFGMRSEREAARALALLGLDPDDERRRRQLLGFRAGQCLMRDHAGRIEAVQIDIGAPAMLDALTTTPAAVRDGDHRAA